MELKTRTWIFTTMFTIDIEDGKQRKEYFSGVTTTDTYGIGLKNIIVDATISYFKEKRNIDVFAFSIVVISLTDVSEMHI